MGRMPGVGVLAAGALLLAGAGARAAERAEISRAIERGVSALKKLQGEDGTWPHTYKTGATALAGLTLLECDVPADDRAVQKAAAVVRQASITETNTYSIALAILFLDRLDDRADTPLIESLTVRLMAGQTPSGGWSYTCPSAGLAEERRLLAHLRSVELKGRRDLPKLPAKGERTVRDLPREIQAQVAVVARLKAGAMHDGAMMGGGDNSNTQFATLALWVGRRYGLPVHGALRGVERRFRSTQNADGGWGYMPTPMRMPGMGPMPAMMSSGSTATMTCAGLLGLVAGHGAVADGKTRKDPDAGPRDLGKDSALKAGLLALAASVGEPVGDHRKVSGATGRAYYYLWSLERVAVILNLKTIGKKDWYAWGSEVLLANQLPDGSWAGMYAESGADTCFALLFLKKSNLATDLSARVRLPGDPGEKVLRAGGVGGGGLKGKGSLKGSGIGKKSGGEPLVPEGKPSPGERSIARPRGASERAVARLTEALVREPGRRDELLAKLREGKGVVYTEGLAGVIPRLDDSSRREAREALAERLTRMKANTLRAYLKDEEPEIRRATALACASKDEKGFVPDLIRLLGDPEPLVERAAHAALKALTKEDFGPKAGAGRPERAKAIAAWQAWWKEHGRE